MSHRRDIRAVTETLVQRYIEGATLRMLAEDYHCHWQTIRKWVKRQLSPEFMKAIADEHHRAEGLGVKHKFRMGYHSPSEYKRGQIRGSAARRYVVIGTIRLRTRRNCHGERVPWYYAIKVSDEPHKSPRNWKPVAIYN
jgi:hypothetical protein